MVSGIGVSIGGTVWEPGRTEELNTLTNEADQRMYQVKGDEENLAIAKPLAKARALATTCLLSESPSYTF